MEIGLGTYLALSSVLFGIGAIGFLTRRNVLLQLMSIEIMLNSVNVLLLAFNRANPSSHDGQVFGLRKLTTADTLASLSVEEVLVKIFATIVLEPMPLESQFLLMIAKPFQVKSL